MREILFRGKRCSAKEWIEGYYCIYPQLFSGVLQSHIFIPSYDAETGKGSCTIYSVIPETVGQFTGLFDRNSKKIFEGDIIENITDHSTAVVRWYEEHSTFMLYSEMKNKVYFLYDNDFKYIDVIGNVYDNPELLRCV